MDPRIRNRIHAKMSWIRITAVRGTLTGLDEERKLVSGDYLPLGGQVLADDGDGVLLVAVHAVQQDEEGLAPDPPLLRAHRQLSSQCIALYIRLSVLRFRIWDPVPF
jgi:hypothetical protein